MSAVRFSNRYHAFVIVDRDGMQSFDRDGRPLVFTTERSAREWLQCHLMQGVDTLEELGEDSSYVPRNRYRGTRPGVPRDGANRDSSKREMRERQ